MSDEDVITKPFAAEIAKQGRAACKKCKQKCDAGQLRLAKIAPSPFGSGMMKMWHHVNCMFEVFMKQRATTKRMESPEDIEGWDLLREDDKDEILNKIQELDKHFGVKTKVVTPQKKPKTDQDVANSSTSSLPDVSDADKPTKDSYFREFRRLIADITNESSYLEKTNIVRKMFTKGKDSNGFKGDITLWCRLLLPGSVKRIYNLQSKQLVKLFSRIFNVNQEEMLEHLEQGDIGETIQKAFEESTTIVPCKKSQLTLKEVDKFLEELSKLTKEDEQAHHFKKIVKKCTGNDLKVIIRLIKHDLRMNAGAKHILEAVHPDAYQAFQASRDISSVIQRALSDSSPGKVKAATKGLKATIELMTPVLPMLAEACKSIEQAMKKCPNGMYSEIKYDGERVQVHKHGSEFKYFSRSLKPVMPHKIKHFKDYIPEAFPHGKDLILDSEILMIDTETGKPLPFGTLGVHKKAEFQNANVCLFVFDCIYYNGEILTDKPIKTRKKILKEAMIEIPNRIVFSEMEEVHRPDDLAAMIAKVLKLGLEGLVLKDIMSIYEPGKRHWLKVKKDYLFGGAMADSADLIVLGAWYGTGKKGGMMSIFLMGCYDEHKKKFCTVTKVHTGHDDETLERLQTELDMIKISGDPDKVPDWLSCTKTMIPDFVARDPKKQPVWEITGAEFTQIHDVHTADGISVRFPRVTKIRDDKDWKTATNLTELKILFKNSKENMDVSLLIDKLKASSSDIPSTSGTGIKKRKDNDVESSPKKPKREKTEKYQPSVKNFFDMKQENKSASLKSFEEIVKDPLPDVFKGVNLLVLDKKFFAAESKDLIRHFIGYGGSLLTDDRWQEATHVLHKENHVSNELKTCTKSARHVTSDWIKHCIKEKNLVDTRIYAVTLL